MPRTLFDNIVDLVISLYFIS